MAFDNGEMRRLTDQGRDLHSQATRQTDEALDEIVEIGQQNRAHGEVEVASPERRQLIRRSLFAAGMMTAGVGAGWLRGAFTTGYADDSSDVSALQTSAALENLAVAVYTKAAGLKPAVSGASNPVILDFVKTTISQHTDHAKAFNAAIAQLGGKAQTGVDTVVYNAVVVPALDKITGPADVVALALTLENAAAETYISFAGNSSNTNNIKTWASIAPVEAQHVAVLLAVQALIAGGAPQLIALPPDVAKLPDAAGSVGFPNSYYGTSAARPAAEGAVS